jgi:transposase-like protein
MTSTKPSGQDPAPKPKRRRFTPEYKLRIVAEYDTALAGDKGAILRRERLYHSHIIEWRQARDAGALERLTDHRTSPARPKKHPAEAENDKLRRQVERLEKELAKNRAAVEVLGKAVALLESVSDSAD